MRKIGAIIFGGIIILIPRLALAVETEFGPANNITEYVSAILAWVIPLAGGLALLMMIYAGYIYMTSQGNPESVGKAKDIVIGVITGIVLLFLIKVIMDQIGVQ